MDTLIVILMVLTNTAQFDSHATGVWLEEFAIPHQIFVDAGVQTIVASPKGGVVPVDPRSLNEETERNFAREIKLLQESKKLSDVSLSDVDAIFFPGGHGTMFDLPGNADVQAAIVELYERGKVVSAVCHGPAAFVDVKLSDGTALVQNKKLAAFTDSEERAVKLDGYMPFMLESKLREQGATVETAADFQEKVVVDGNLITGQNPPSSAGVALEIVKALKR